MLTYLKLYEKLQKILAHLSSNSRLKIALYFLKKIHNLSNESFSYNLSKTYIKQKKKNITKSPLRNKERRAEMPFPLFNVELFKVVVGIAFVSH